MSNESVYLPGKIRDRIQDLMKSHKVTQSELATRIGCPSSSQAPYHSSRRKRQDSFTPLLLLSPQNLRFCGGPS